MVGSNTFMDKKTMALLCFRNSACRDSSRVWVFFEVRLRMAAASWASTAEAKLFRPPSMVAGSVEGPQLVVTAKKKITAAVDLTFILQS